MSTTHVPVESFRIRDREEALRDILEEIVWQMNHGNVSVKALAKAALTLLPPKKSTKTKVIAQEPSDWRRPACDPACEYEGCPDGNGNRKKKSRYK